MTARGTDGRAAGSGRRGAARNPTPGRRWRWLAVLALGLAAVVAGCSRGGSDAPARERPATATPQTFQGGPAAHPNDWCAGHGVPESACTRCNPALIPQFRARGDWCAEHAVPESQCTICHPELLRQGVAPPRPAAGTPSSENAPSRPEGGDAAPAVAPGTVVRLARPVVAERVGIETAAAEARPLADEVTAPVRVDFDPARLARVSARVVGVVRAVAVDLGAQVRPGDLLVTLDSAAAASTRADLAAARVRVANAEVALRRARELRAAGVGPQAEVEAAETALAAARADLVAQRAASGVAGGGAGRVVRVVAPRAGVVVRRAASVGQQVDAEEVLVEVADLATMWALLDVADADAPRLRVGQPVTIEMDGLAAPLHATLAWLAPTVDPHTRTVQARAVLPNPDGALRGNAFGRARIAVAASRAGVVVPRDALQRVHGQDVVFVARSPVAYEARVVEVALATAREALVARGVAAGERVVTTGGFALKTELLRDAIGAGCCDDEG